MIDIGANLSNTQFAHDLPHVINNALANNVSALILTSTNFETYQSNLEIISKYQSDIYIRTTYGLHPHSIEDHSLIFENFESSLLNSNVVSIGEFGLDYFRMNQPKENQQNIMEQILDIAYKNEHLSLFLHERESFKDFHAILHNFKGNNKSVVHCFTGTKEQAKAYLDLGCYIGITGWISDSRRNHDIQEALKYIPLDRLMIETDSPYLTPCNMPTKIRRNEPAFLKYIVQSISHIKKIDESDIITNTINNSVDFFSLCDYNKPIIKNNKVII
jgi:TatD DNase family protein